MRFPVILSSQSEFPFNHTLIRTCSNIAGNGKAVTDIKFGGWNYTLQKPHTFHGLSFILFSQGFHVIPHVGEMDRMSLCVILSYGIWVHLYNLGDL